MSRKSESARVTKEHDRRIKLTDEQRLEIVKLYAEGHSLRGLGRLYDVDKALIKGIVDTEWKAKQAAMNILRQKVYRERIQNSRELKDKRNLGMKKHREYKEFLYKQGSIKIEKKI